MNTSDNLTKYKIFFAVAECQNISKAAAKLYLSQPAVSITIRKLEESLNTTLFIRQPKGVSLTENGRLLYDSAKRALNILADAEENLKSSKTKGRLRIAASNVLCKYFLVPYLKEFTYLYPDTDVSITCTSSRKACSMLEDCCTDLALVAKPEHSGILQYHSLGVIEYIFVCTPAYKNRLNCANDKIFRLGNIMLPDKDNGSRTHIDIYFAEQHMSPSHIMEVTDMDTLIEFAKMGIGISCVVKQFVQRELDSGSLLELELPDPVPPREIGFLYHDIRPVSENIQNFIHLNSIFSQSSGKKKSICKKAEKADNH